MPVNYYQEDCEASNSSSGEDSQASDTVVLSPRKLHNRYLSINRLRSKTNIKPNHSIRPRNQKSIIQETQRSVSSCDVETGDESLKTSPRLSVSSKYIADESLSNTLQTNQLTHQCKKRNKMKMPFPRRNKTDAIAPTKRDGINASGEGFLSVPSQESSESRRVFPFLQTPSGNLKVGPNQVVFESKKVSVLVADPKHTKVNVRAEIDNKTFIAGSQDESIPVAFGSDKLSHKHTDGEINNLMTLNEHTPVKNIDNYIEGCQPSQLQKEYSLQRLSSSSLPPVDWNKTPLPFKTELFTRLLHRITNYINPDVEILISNEVFSCHLLVLQCYSDYFDQTKQASKVRLPEDCVTPRAFMTIYNWMIYPGSDSFRLLSRENILEVFVASQNLGIKELEEQCWTFINSDHIFSEETAFLLFSKAKKMNNTTITQLMIPRIMRFFLKLVGTTNFVELDLDDVCIFLRSNFIAVHNEIEVFMSAVRWLMHDWERRKLHLCEIMKCIRFGWIAPWQLVDIRRNPENPEFMRVTSQPDVQQLIEDGLSYAIIKYWYGNQTQDYYHWIDLLGLQEPSQRNWIDEEKNYVTYREFLNDLETYQEPGTLESMQLRSQQLNIKTDAFPPPPTVAEFVAQRARNLEDLNEKQEFSRKGSENQINIEMQQSATQTGSLTQGEARITSPHSSQPDKNTSNQLQSQCTNAKGSVLLINDSSLKSHKNEHDDSKIIFTSTEHVMEANNTQISNKKSYPKYISHSAPAIITKQALQDVSYPHVEDSLTVHASLDIKKIPEKANRNFCEKEISEKRHKSSYEKYFKPLSHKPETKVSSLFSHISRESQSLQCMNQISISSLGASSRNYLMEGSLFFSDNEAVLVFGGIDPHSPYGFGQNTGKEIYRYVPHVNSWEHVGELPEPRHHHSVAFLKGKIFLAGGADPRTEDSTGKSDVVRTVWSYDPVTRNWFRETEMLTPRKNFGLVISSGKLYAIGGQDKKGRVLSSVECFNPTVGVWEEMTSIGVGRMGMAATKFRDFIWVAGGMISFKSTSLTNSVECYDTRQNMWFPSGVLRYSRGFSQFLSMNDTLYLIGGAGCMDEQLDSTASIGAIDIWDEKSKKWYLKDEMAIPRHGHSLAYLGTQILIIGGVSTMYMRALSDIECFCCVRGTWIHGIANLPTPLSGHGSVTLPPASLMQ